MGFFGKLKNMTIDEPLDNIKEFAEQPDMEHRSMYVGSKMGLSASSISNLSMALKETGVLLFKSDADVVNFYQNYASVKAQTNTLAASFHQQEVAEKEAVSKNEKAAKAAERYEKAKEAAAADESVSGYTHDGFEL